MKIVKAGHEHISKKGLSPYQFIEKIGRTCYKSEDRITETSAKDFVKGLVSRGHTAMIEHFWVHLTFKGSYSLFSDQIADFVWNRLKDGGDLSTFFRFMQVTYLSGITFISFSIRAATDLVDHITALNGSVELEKTVPPLIREMLYEVQCSYFDFFAENSHFFNGGNIATSNLFAVWGEESFLDLLKKQNFSDIEQFKETEIMKHITHTHLFRCNRGVSHELVRHRPCSFAQESTRYCNYSKSKFGNEITVIEPQPVLYNSGEYTEYQRTLWKDACLLAEEKYFDLLNAGASPQEARGVLPNDLKTEVVVTANETEWQHIVNLRSKQTTGKAHPQMVEVMTPVYEELKVLSEGRIK